MPPIPVLIGILIGLILLSAFFSGSEAAFISVNKIRLRHMMEQKKGGAHRVYGLVSQIDRLIATILVGNNLVNTAIATLATYLFTQLLGPGQGVLAATVLITLIIVIFGELTPKIVATNHPERVAFTVRHLMQLLIAILLPFTKLLTLISNGFIRLLGGNPNARSPLLTEEEIKMMIRIGKEEGYYGDNERKMLERIFHFDDTEIRDVMTPIEKVVSVPTNVSEEELERVLTEEGHNRIPVHGAKKDDIIGILYVRDLLYLFKNSSLIRLEDLWSQPYFAPPRMKTADLLREFLHRKIQIAIVKDMTSGKCLGLVTLEDLIEEIVGEIEEVEPRPEALR
ncbi:MAG: hypothetical protein MOGMAGMI_00138 [Candidatus Omnitrophica bacterium]|nr:hypothetical protein [Candidatus Omnitrophota bacterium]